jgi:hypothetical protein
MFKTQMPLKAEKMNPHQWAFVPRIDPWDLSLIEQHLTTGEQK